MKRIAKVIIRYFLANYLSLKKGSIIMRGCILNFQTKLEGKNVIHKRVSISNSRIGYGTYIGDNSILINASVGKFCSISQNVKIIFGQHPSKIFVSTHPAFFSTKKQAGFTYVQKDLFKESSESSIEYSVSIGNDVWIGSDVKILEGLSIGDGAIIAAGAVVVKDLDPYTIYGGVPAKKIGERFSAEEKDFLLEFKWWEYDVKWIEENAPLFVNIEKFKFNFSQNNSIEKGEI